MAGGLPGCSRHASSKAAIVLKSRRKRGRMPKADERLQTGNDQAELLTLHGLNEDTPTEHSVIIRKFLATQDPARGLSVPRFPSLSRASVSGNISDLVYMTLTILQSRMTA